MRGKMIRETWHDLELHCTFNALLDQEMDNRMEDAFKWNVRCLQNKYGKLHRMFKRQNAFCDSTTNKMEKTNVTQN